MFLKVSQNSQKNACARVSCNFIKKEALAQVFSCEFCETFKNKFFYRTPPDDCFCTIIIIIIVINLFKGPLSGLRHFLTTESPLKIMKNVFYFMLKALFIISIFTFFSWLFGHVEKPLEKKANVIFKIYNVTDWETNNCNTDIAQYLKK